MVCQYCGCESHDEKDECDIVNSHCVNCGGDHTASARTCPAWTREREILRVNYTQGVSLHEARIVECSDLNVATYAQITRAKTPVDSVIVKHASVQALVDVPDMADAKACKDDVRNSISGFRVLLLESTEHFAPKPLVIAERFKFHSRKQQVGESVSDYVVSLKKLAKDCDFQDFLNQALRDRLVCGLMSEVIQKKLLAEKDLDLAKATEIALAVEMATKNIEEMGQPVSIGHIGKKCPNKRSKGHVGAQNKYVEVEKCDRDNDDEDGFLFGLYSVNDSDNSGYKVNLKLNSNPVEFEIDTGAAVTVCAENVYYWYFSHLPLQKPTVRLRDYGEGRIPLLGEISVPVNYGSQNYVLPLRVVCGDRPSLLGRNWLKHVKLDWPSIFALKRYPKSDGVKSEIDKLLAKHHKLFEKGLGTITEFKAQVKVKDGAPQPIFCKSLKERVEKELERLQIEGALSRVERSDWATPIVVVPKSDKSIRLCGDFKVTE
ncbi:uncharacterized protein [Argopecten irradians]|uniref:uncharacterized protein n=1 Tax=Argopecten irradians TaxID=31199 RepID=UPI00371809E1